MFKLTRVNMGAIEQPQQVLATSAGLGREEQATTEAVNKLL